jgi:hypothetical protein
MPDDLTPKLPADDTATQPTSTSAPRRRDAIGVVVVIIVFIAILASACWH